MFLLQIFAENQSGFFWWGLTFFIAAIFCFVMGMMKAGGLTPKVGRILLFVFLAASVAFLLVSSY